MSELKPKTWVRIEPDAVTIGPGGDTITVEQYDNGGVVKRVVIVTSNWYLAAFAEKASEAVSRRIRLRQEAISRLRRAVALPEEKP